MRMRVIIDISQPLCRGRQVSFDDGSEGWISFKYEHLPNVCYWCGRLTHDEKDCIMWLQSKGSLKVENQQFGQWLRASQITSLKKMVIDVKGYGEDWVVRPDAVQTSRQSVLVVQDQPSAMVVTAIVSEEGNQNKHFPEELPMTITGGGGQKSVNFEHSRNSNLAKPTPDFEEQLQQIGKALSVDCVSPILSAENPDVVGVKSHVDKNKFTRIRLVTYLKMCVGQICMVLQWAFLGLSLRYVHGQGKVLGRISLISSTRWLSLVQKESPQREILPKAWTRRLSWRKKQGSLVYS